MSNLTACDSLFFDTVNAPALRSQRITAIHEDRAGVLWVATETGEISCLRDGDFYSFDDGEEEEINSLPVDTHGFLWAGGWDGARRYKLPETGCGAAVHAFERVKPPPLNNQASNQILTILEAADGTRFALELAQNESGDERFKFTRDGRGRLMVNVTGGIAQLDEGRWRVSRAAEITGKKVRSFYADREGNLWLGTNADGLLNLKPSFVEFYDESSGVLKNQTGAVLQDSRGNLWIAGFGLHRFENNRFTREKSAPLAYLLALAETRDGTAALAAIELHAPDVAILDVDMPHQTGFDVLRHSNERGGTTRTILLTVHDEPEFFNEAMRLGAMAYILKECAIEEIVQAIRRVVHGERFASPRMNQLPLAPVESKRIRPPDKPHADRTPGSETASRLQNQQRNSRHALYQFAHGKNTPSQHQREVRNRLQQRADAIRARKQNAFVTAHFARISSASHRENSSSKRKIYILGGIPIGSRLLDNRQRVLF